ncbi:hypothetical protein LCGC14_0397680 [marine sediment metagenome]|uniref:Desulfoferrodoxin N-terminal domain-containing protein n=1 Tax=marine sediment metagenome TaxID=412755 RepID=A0A0F9TFU0_9ZZZZ|nr:hypothetical protein [Phycisphaerae bacterium]HDZ42635.1 hypothetical protein [Phycisphaerae bacterium]
MNPQPESPPPQWDLDDWEEALTIHVGVSYVCRDCGNVVMVTRGGVGILDLRCCGKPMEQVALPEETNP